MYILVRNLTYSSRYLFFYVTKQLRFDFLHLLWSVGTVPISDTQNPEISRFSTAHAYKYKTKQQPKMKRRQKDDIFVG